MLVMISTIIIFLPSVFFGAFQDSEVLKMLKGPSHFNPGTIFISSLILLKGFKHVSNSVLLKLMEMGGVPDKI